MNLLLAMTIGVLYAGAVYCILRRHLVKLIVGLALLSHGANLLIFTAAGVTRTPPPVVPEGLIAPLSAVSDPLPQALILTAIVISFSVLAFALILFHRTYRVADTDNIDQLDTTEK
jgi:multicomponent Na+:H+ antiporter subunit C